MADSQNSISLGKQPKMLSTRHNENLMKDNRIALAKFDELLFECFLVLNVYKNRDESYKSINRIYHKHLDNFQYDLLLECLETWPDMYDNFPTIREIQQWIFYHPRYDTSKFTLAEKGERFIHIGKSRNETEKEREEIREMLLAMTEAERQVWRYKRSGIKPSGAH